MAAWKSLVEKDVEVSTSRIVWHGGRRADRLGMSVMDVEWEGKPWFSEGSAGLGRDGAPVNVS